MPICFICSMNFSGYSFRCSISLTAGLTSRSMKSRTVRTRDCSSSTISTFMWGSFTVSRSILWGRGDGAEQRPSLGFEQNAHEEQQCHRGDRDEVEGGGDSDRDGGRDRVCDERAGPAHDGL